MITGEDDKKMTEIGVVFTDQPEMKWNLRANKL
jgi:hypothetical protein